MLIDISRPRPTMSNLSNVLPTGAHHSHDMDPVSREGGDVKFTTLETRSQT